MKLLYSVTSVTKSIGILNTVIDERENLCTVVQTASITSSHFVSLSLKFPFLVLRFYFLNPI